MAFFESLESRQLFAAGDLDLTFGAAGESAVKLKRGNLQQSDVVVQPGDRVVVSGTYKPTDGPRKAFVYRYTSEGKIDQDFAAQSLIDSHARGIDTLKVVAVMNDGRIIAFATDNEAANTLIVMRLLASGKIDNTFGKKGVVRISEFDMHVNGATLQEDGRILLFGSGPGARVERLTVNGKLDNTFGVNGVFESNFGFEDDDVLDGISFPVNATSLAVQPNGTIVISGTVGRNDSDSKTDSFQHPYFARLTKDGALADGQFDQPFIELFADQTSNSFATSLGVFPSDSGTFFLATEHDDVARFEKYRDNGETDLLFGDDDGGITLRSRDFTVLRQSDGKFLISAGGRTTRYYGDASWDQTFGPAGLIETNQQIIGVGSDGSLIFKEVTSEVVRKVRQYTIHIARRWREEGPAGLLVAPDISKAPKGSYRFSVQWRDDDAVDAFTLPGSYIRITGPDGASYRANFDSVTKLGSGKLRTAIYRFAPPGGGWGIADNGTYTVRLLGSAVKDVHGAAASKRTLGAFLVQL